MREKMYIVGENFTRLFLRAGREAGINIGLGAKRIHLGTHYEWVGDDKKWFTDTSYRAYVYFLLWKLEIVYVRVRPVTN